MHGKTSDNGVRLVYFAAAQNMVISSTTFQHRNFHNATWQFTDHNTKNQIEIVVIDERHASSIPDVHTIRGANMDSDHLLVAAKMSRSCDHKRLLNPYPFAFWNSFTMLLQIPTSIRSGNTCLTPCTQQLRKRLDIVNSSSCSRLQCGLVCIVIQAFLSCSVEGVSNVLPLRIDGGIWWNIVKKFQKASNLSRSYLLDITPAQH